jgi:hypothetical protein
MIAAFTKATEARTKARDKRNAEAMAAIAAPAPKRTLDPAAIYAERARGGAHGLVAPGETRARR